jgi:superfamily II DNA/RNA helicase
MPLPITWPINTNQQLREILRMAPKQRQTLLFSATFNGDVAGLVALSLKQPVRLAADAAAAAPSTLSQEVGRAGLRPSAYGVVQHLCKYRLEMEDVGYRMRADEMCAMAQWQLEMFAAAAVVLCPLPQ